MSPDSEEMLACIPRLRRYARVLVRDSTAADDLVQDTLERAWSKFALWRRGTDMRSWLFSIMHNMHIDQRRKPAIMTTSLTSDEDFTVPTRATQADSLEVRDLQAMLQRLPDDQREVLLLVALKEMTYEQVATTLDIPMGTVMSRLARGREKLRALLEGRELSATFRVVK